MYPAHLGTLHPVEQALTIVLAFGPFIVLGIVIVVRRRADSAAHRAGHVSDAEGSEHTG